MAALRTTVTNQVAWTIAEDGSGDPYFVRRGTEDEDNPLSDPGFYAHKDSIWTDLLGDADHQRLVVPVAEDGNTVLLKFFGDPASTNPTGSDPAGSVPMGIGAIWGVSELVQGGTTEYVGDYLGRFDLTVGNHAVSSSTVLPTSPAAAFGRRATVQVDRAMLPGLRTTGVQGDAAAVLVADSLGYSHLVVELRCARSRWWSTNRNYKGYGAPNIVAASKLGFLYRVA